LNRPIALDAAGVFAAIPNLLLARWPTLLFYLPDEGRADFVPVGCAFVVALRKSKRRHAVIARFSLTAKRDHHAGRVDAKSAVHFASEQDETGLSPWRWDAGPSVERRWAGRIPSLSVELPYSQQLCIRFPCCRHNWHRVEIAWLMPEGREPNDYGSPEVRRERSYGHAARQTETGLEHGKRVFPSRGEVRLPDVGSWVVREVVWGNHRKKHALRNPLLVRDSSPWTSLAIPRCRGILSYHSYQGISSMSNEFLRFYQKWHRLENWLRQSGAGSCDEGDPDVSPFGVKNGIEPRP
jgi:hypothetical protein